MPAYVFAGSKALLTVLLTLVLILGYDISERRRSKMQKSRDWFR